MSITAERIADGVRLLRPDLLPDEAPDRLPEPDESAIATYVSSLLGAVGVSESGRAQIDDGRVYLSAKWSRAPGSDPMGDVPRLAVTVTLKLPTAARVHGGSEAAEPCFRQAVASALNVDPEDLKTECRFLQVTAECEVEP